MTTANNKTILVIEDDVTLLDVITEKLKKSGYTVIVSRSVEQAFTTEILDGTNMVTKTSIEIALAHLNALEKVDAIWLDHNLIGPDDGIDFVVKLKANGKKWSNVPIFVVSNSDNKDLVTTYNELGIAHYYIKAEHTLATIINDINLALQTS